MRAYFGRDSNGNEWISADASGWLALIVGRYFFVDLIIVVAVCLVSFFTGFHLVSVFAVGLSYYLLLNLDILRTKLNKRPLLTVDAIISGLLLISFSSLFLQSFGCSFLVETIGKASDKNYINHDIYSLFSNSGGTPVVLSLLIVFFIGTLLSLILFILCLKRKQRRLFHHIYFIEMFCYIFILIMCISSISATGYGIGKSNVFLLIKCSIFIIFCLLFGILYCKDAHADLSIGQKRKNAIALSLVSIICTASVVCASIGINSTSQKLQTNASIADNRRTAFDYLNRNSYSYLFSLDDYGDDDIKWAKEVARIAVDINENKTTNVNELLTKLDKLSVKYELYFTFNRDLSQTLSNGSVNDIKRFISDYSLSINDLYSYRFEKGTISSWSTTYSFKDAFKFFIKLAVDKNVKNITIPDSVTTIYEKQFEGFKNISTIKIHKDVVSIGKNAFASCSSLANIYYEATNCTCDSSAFEKSGSESGDLRATIGKNVQKIPSNLFNSSNIKTVAFEDQSKCLEIGERAFNYCTFLETIVLSPTITKIGPFAFQGCKNITSISIPSSVVNIGEHTFASCQKLEDCIIPNGVEILNSYLFSDCKALTNVTIPNTVNVISKYSLAGCSSLKKITFLGTKDEWSDVVKEKNWNQNTGSFYVECTDGIINI